MSRSSLLVVDDHEHILKQLGWALAEDFDVHTASSREAALEMVRHVRPRLMTVDLALTPGGGRREGFEVLQEALRLDPTVKAVVITSDQEEETALEAVRMGAFDYFIKPLPLDELRGALKRAAYLGELDRRADTRYEGPSDATGIIGESEAVAELRTLVRRVAETDFTGLISGESGVGKEIVAQAIWKLSKRRDRAFVVVNCAAIPEPLLETELFGHEKGSFTGAHAQKKGKFELADGGTLFLDEIGELGPRLQAKLLRFLQERSIERVGGARPIQLDVRILAATNRDLEQDVADKLFREDLYYRLKVLPIRVPPLRERGEDVLLLANHFRERLSSEEGLLRKTFSREATLALRSYEWPGNVRELENVIRAAAVRSPRALISARHLELPRRNEAPQGLRAARDELERSLVERALSRNNGIISRAARELSISRVSLYDLLDKHGLRNGHGNTGD
jgi:two-component system, NtrC family, response regulator